MAYCASRYHSIRRRTIEVRVGEVGVGGENPLRVQSMTTTDTQDVEATVRQAIALAEAGCEIVRVTAPSLGAARALREIRARLSAAGFSAVPLVADIHFLPATAMEAVEHVEKVRVNPGNYADRKKFAVREYSDAEYQRELERLHEAFSPLVKRCRQLGRALRIGTNHGSLSDRIMNRYGDTPLGMVESALEFIRIAEANDFRDIILSMKASNPKVMIQAYRLLVERMDAAGMAYPLHLGVTEAGDGEDGRIKSAIGIGSLLLDGLGDTIRVSLTEDSVYEIPVARALAAKAMKLWERGVRKAECGVEGAFERAPAFSAESGFSRRVVTPLVLGPDTRIATDQPPRVIVRTGPVPADADAWIRPLADACTRLQDTPIEGVLLGAGSAADVARALELAPRLAPLAPALFIALPENLDTLALDRSALPAAPRIGFLKTLRAADRSEEAACFIAQMQALGTIAVLALPAGEADQIVGKLAPLVASSVPADLIITLAEQSIPRTAGAHALGAWRRLAESLDAHRVAAPVWIRNTDATAIRAEPAFLSRLLEASILTGGLLTDGIGDLVSVETETDLVRSVRLAYNILQGAGARISKTEFVACPSCGRTLFDLQTTTQRIRAKTGHLKGVKLAIMGCIVNGPGEMADADFGYVGGAPGKINLYVGRNCVAYGIPAEEADRRLIELIKAHGKWTDPPPAPAPESAAAPATVP